MEQIAELSKLITDYAKSVLIGSYSAEVYTHSVQLAPNLQVVTVELSKSDGRLKAVLKIGDIQYFFAQYDKAEKLHRVEWMLVREDIMELLRQWL